MARAFLPTSLRNRNPTITLSFSEEADTIAQYAGELVTWDQLDEPYGACTARIVHEDGAARRGVGTMVNSYENTNKQQNARLLSTGHHVKVQATRTIRNNDEILVWYGFNFWHNNASPNAKAVKNEKLVYF